MLHWTPFRADTSEVTPIAALSREPSVCSKPAARSDHARMLGHAATRRRAATGEDRAYWKACAPAAIAKAASIRTSSAFTRLP